MQFGPTSAIFLTHGGGQRRGVKKEVSTGVAYALSPHPFATVQSKTGELNLVVMLIHVSIPITPHYPPSYPNSSGHQTTTDSTIAGFVECTKNISLNISLFGDRKEFISA